MGGAIARKDSDATAFPDRDKACALTVAPKWDDRSDDKACIERARSFHDIMSPYAAEGVYVNYLGNDDADLVESAYHGRFEKLVALKNKRDPRTASV